MRGEGNGCLSIAHIRRFCGQTNFAAGLTYYRAGRVLSISRSSAAIEAQVQGPGFKTQRVQVDLGDASWAATCTCARHSQWREACKHIAAALCAVADELRRRDPLYLLHRIAEGDEARRRRENLDDHALRALVGDYFGNGRLSATVESQGRGPDLQVTIREDGAPGWLTLSVPGARVPAFLDEIRGCDSVVLQGTAARMQVASDPAAVESGPDGGYWLRTPRGRRRLSPQDAVRARVGTHWLYCAHRFYPLPRPRPSRQSA